MKYDSIDLRSIYNTIRDCYSHRSAVPPLPERDEPEYIQFRKSYKRVLKAVPQSNGIYLWYSVRNEVPVEYVYVGESHGNKGGLRNRLDDEFRRTYHGFWASVFKTDKYLEETIRIFGNRERYKPSKSYDTDIRNDFDRRGATHIAFCHHIPDDRNLVAIQDDLIQMFGNPRGNKDVRAIPLPDDQLSTEAKTIHLEFIKLTQTSL